MPSSAVSYSLQARAFSALAKPRNLTISDDTGRILGRVRVESAETKIDVRPFRLQEGTRTLRLHTEQGPERLGETDSRVASIFISPIQLIPLADVGAD